MFISVFLYTASENTILIVHELLSQPISHFKFDLELPNLKGKVNKSSYSRLQASGGTRFRTAF